MEGTHDTPVRLYLDLSNILWSGRGAAGTRRETPEALRLHADNLYRLMAAGRRVESAWLIANALTPKPVLDRFAPFFRILLVETGAQTGGEQAGDEKLQNRMYQELLVPWGKGLFRCWSPRGALGLASRSLPSGAPSTNASRWQPRPQGH